MSKRPRYVLMGIAAVLGGISIGCNTPGIAKVTTVGTAPERMAPTPKTIMPSRRNIVGYALLAGQLYWPAEAKANIQMPNAGVVDTVRTPVGSRVEKGQVLLTLQDGSNESASSTAKLNLSAAQSAYSAAVLQYGDPVRQAREELQGAQQAEREARADNDPTAMQSAEQTRQTAESTLHQAQSQEISNLATYRQQLDSARAAEAVAHNAQLQAEVRAPISGTVLSLKAPAGVQIGGSNAPIGEVVNLNAVQIRATYAADDQKIVRNGARVVITFADNPEKLYDGRVTRIRTLPDARGVTENMATISFSNSAGLVKPSSRLQRVGIREGRVEDALSVPVAAVRKDSQGNSFVTDESGKSIPVQTGLSDGEYIEIKAGLSENTSIRCPG